MDKNIETTEPMGYSKPEIVDHGSLTDLTAGFTTGTHLDATFPRGTPNSAVTHSGP